MEKEVIIFKIINESSFIALDEKGFNYYNIFHKNQSNENLKRLSNYMITMIKTGGSDSTLVFNLRPTIHFAIREEHPEWKIAFDIIENKISINSNKFNLILDFIVDIMYKQNRALLFQLLCYFLLFKENNIVINFSHCYYCGIKYDLYCFIPELSSIICKACFNNIDIKEKQYISDIHTLKLNDEIYDNMDNWFRLNIVENKNIKQVIELHNQVYTYSFG